MQVCKFLHQPGNCQLYMFSWGQENRKRNIRGGVGGWVAARGRSPVHSAFQNHRAAHHNSQHLKHTTKPAPSSSTNQKAGHDKANGTTSRALNAKGAAAHNTTYYHHRPGNCQPTVSRVIYHTTKIIMWWENATTSLLMMSSLPPRLHHQSPHLVHPCPQSAQHHVRSMVQRQTVKAKIAKKKLDKR